MKAKGGKKERMAEEREKSMEAPEKRKKAASSRRGDARDQMKKE